MCKGGGVRGILPTLCSRGAAAAKTWGSKLWVEGKGGPPGPHLDPYLNIQLIIYLTYLIPSSSVPRGFSRRLLISFPNFLRITHQHIGEASDCFADVCVGTAHLLLYHLFLFTNNIFLSLFEFTQVTVREIILLSKYLVIYCYVLRKCEVVHSRPFLYSGRLNASNMRQDISSV